MVEGEFGGLIVDIVVIAFATVGVDEEGGHPGFGEVPVVAIMGLAPLLYDGQAMYLVVNLLHQAKLLFVFCSINYCDTIAGIAHDVDIGEEFYFPNWHYLVMDIVFRAKEASLLTTKG